MVDITGQVFGQLRALSQNAIKWGRPAWVCLCECGNETTALAKDLRSGRTKSCGCLRRIRKPRVDIANQKFGRLVAIEYVGGNKWKCLCECGTETEVLLAALRTGKTRSCGCLSREKTSQRFRAKLLGRRFGRLEVVSGGDVCALASGP